MRRPVRPDAVGRAEWNADGHRIRHLLAPGERVLAFEDIALIGGLGIPDPPPDHLHLGLQSAVRPVPLVFAILAAPLAVANWSPTIRFHHGRVGHGGPRSLAACFACALLAGLSTRIVVTDLRILLVADPRGFSLAVVFNSPAARSAYFAAPRQVIARASRRWYWLHWARLRLEFADGSWLACGTSVFGGRGKVRRIVAALQPAAPTVQRCLHLGPTLDDPT